jgi:ribosome-binding ATPase YchF (GTP1/OBG family)
MTYPLSFKDFLAIIAEDTQQDIAKIQSDISMIDAQIVQRTTPLNARKMALQKMLALKQKQAQAEQAKQGPQSTMQAQDQQGQTAGNQTTTPGSSGAATPGGSPTIR